MSLSNTLAGDHMTCDTPQSDRAKLWRRSTGRGGEHWRRYPATIFLARAKLWRRNTDEAMKIVDPATIFSSPGEALASKHRRRPGVLGIQERLFLEVACQNQPDHN